MNHDRFVGRVQHRAELASRGDAERAIRATFETLSERLQPESAAHIAAQLPPELARHLASSVVFEHITLDEFYERVALREGGTRAEAAIHAQAVIETLRDALTPGALDKLEHQLPGEFRELFGSLTAQLC